MNKKQTDYSDVCPNEHVYTVIGKFMYDNAWKFAKGLSKNEFDIMCTALGITADDAVEAMRFMTMEGRRVVVENGCGRPIVL